MNPEIKETSLELGNKLFQTLVDNIHDVTENIKDEQTKAVLEKSVALIVLEGERIEALIQKPNSRGNETTFAISLERCYNAETNEDLIVIESGADEKWNADAESEIGVIHKDSHFSKRQYAGNGKAKFIEGRRKPYQYFIHNSYIKEFIETGDIAFSSEEEELLDSILQALQLAEDKGNAPEYDEY